MAGLCVAIVGAESTGKTTLADAVAAQLNASGTPARVVPEYLREWCAQHGRAPGAAEQAHIARVQSQRFEAARGSAAAQCVVISDTTPLMTAVYSDVYFGDVSLYPMAIEHHRNYTLTLLTGLDIAWVADGIQRDSEAMRKNVDRRLRAVLAAHQIAYASVYGQGNARTDSALQAITYRDASRPNARGAAQENPWHWVCEKCSDADCEHRLFGRLTQ